jgi:hypothetical protein
VETSARRSAVLHLASVYLKIGSLVCLVDGFDAIFVLCFSLCEVSHAFESLDSRRAASPRINLEA